MDASEPAPHRVPGTLWDSSTSLGRVLASLDDAGDALFGRLRGRKGPDTVAAAVSNLADYGVVWVLLALLKARQHGPGRRRAIIALGAAGVTSYSLNRAAKRLVGRQRPDPGPTAGPDAAPPVPSALPVRRPTSTSFPSGHTLAAFCTAIVLPDSLAGAGASVGFAAAVAASRVHLRAHHLSDVLAGGLSGAAAGFALRPLVAALTRRTAPEPRRRASPTARGRRRAPPE